MAFASRRYGRVDAPQLVIPGDNLISGWNLLPEGNQILDVSGNGEHLLTTRGGMHRKGLLGNVHDFYRPSENYASRAGYAQGPTNNRITVCCWCRSCDDTTQGLITKGQSGVSFGDYDLYLSSEEARFALNNNAVVVGNGIESVFANCSWHFVVGRYDGSTASIWVDGHLVASSAYAGGIDNDYTNLYLGLCYPFAAASYLDGSIAAPRVYNEAKSDAWIQREYLRGARAVQFGTDWGAHISTGAEGGTLYQPISNLPIIVTDTTGRYYVDTDTINGSIVKTLRCSTAGSNAISTSFFAEGTGDAAYGTWDFWVKSDGTDDNITIRLVASDFGANYDGYALIFRKNTRTVALVKVDAVGGSSDLAESAGDIWNADTWYHVKVTRRYNGYFVVYINGVQLLTATDNEFKTSLYMTFPGEVGNEISLGSRDGNYGFKKMIGVV